MHNETNSTEKTRGPKDYEMIGCQEAGGKIEIEKVLEYFSNRCFQSCPNWNLCNQMSNNA